LTNQLLKSLQFTIESALREDRVFDDITSDLTIGDNNSPIKFQINCREDLIFCGNLVITEVIKQLQNSSKFAGQNFNLEFLAKDGDSISKFQNIAQGTADIKIILAGERVILNLIQHLSSIATSTNRYVTELNSNKIKILDTRKTLPNLRYIQKYAVKCGGGYNHRMNLQDRILIKDNHISACGGIKNALQKTLNKNLSVEIECDSYLQVKEAIEFNPDIIMLDNMSIDEAQKSINLIRNNSNKTLIEVSGGINLATIKNYRHLDIDFISVGSLTNSCQVVDIGLDFIKS
jgi:nicotinate-nucleotide pyrophosphorylase (carboxylating)